MALQALMPADGVRTWSAPGDWQADAAQVRDDEAGALAMASTVDVLPGHCGVCRRHAGFAMPAGHSMREGLACRHCGCNARQRAAAAVLLHALERPGSASVYLTEHASPFYLALRPLLGRLHGSEYAPSARQRLRLSSWLWRHGAMAWVRHGDVTSSNMQANLNTTATRSAAACCASTISAGPCSMRCATAASRSPRPAGCRTSRTDCRRASG